MKKTIGAVVVAASLVAAPAMAQQHGHAGQGAGMHAMEGGGQHCAQMMGGASPGIVLEHAEDLGLSAEQVTRLETLRDESQAAVRPHMTAAMEARTEASGLLDADRPDLDAYEAALSSAADRVVQAHTAMARTVVATRDVLTPEQREQLSGLSPAGMSHAGSGPHQGMSHGAGAMGMMSCPMMGAGGGHGVHGAGSGQ